MGHLPATTFGIGTPSIYAPWGLSPAAAQSIGIQPQIFGQPFVPQTFVGYGANPLQQVPLLVQTLLQQLQQVQVLQQQQLVYLQQILQIVPAQLQQLQQLVPQLQQNWSPYAQAPLGFGLAPQTFSGQTSGHVM